MTEDYIPKKMVSMINASTLFADFEPGPHLCFLCGTQCGDRHKTKDVISDRFTGLDGVASPGSPYVCPGCVASMQEKTSVTMWWNEDVRHDQKVRGYSWILNKTVQWACTKKHNPGLLTCCENPPEPPFAIVLARSGQKHLIYRTPANLTRDVVTVRLELDLVTFRPQQLTERVRLCKAVSGAAQASLRSHPMLRSPSLEDELTTVQCMRIAETLGEAALENWQSVRMEPLTRLALYLAPSREKEADDESADPGDE